MAGVSPISGTSRIAERPLRQHGLHGGQIHCGLARSGDAMQQHGQKLPLINRGDDLSSAAFLRSG